MVRLHTSSRRPRVSVGGPDDAASARDVSYALLLTAVRELGPIGRRRLVEATGLSFPTITNLVAQLLRAGVLRELPSATPPGDQPARKGRREVPLDFSQDPTSRRLVAGVHIRQHRTTVTLFDLVGVAVVENEVAHRAGDDARTTISAGVELVSRLLREQQAGRVVALAVSVGGVVDADRGVLRRLPTVGWYDVPVRAAYRSIGPPVVFDSSIHALVLNDLHQPRPGIVLPDVEAAARDRWAGAVQSSLTVMVAGEVSAALVVGGRIYRGSGATGLDVAHVKVAGGPGALCDCGERDCLAATVTNVAVNDRAVERGLTPVDQLWNRTTNVAKVDSTGLAELRSQRAVWLGRTIADVAAMLGVEQVVLTGYLGTHADAEHALASGRARSEVVSTRRPPAWHHFEPAEQVWDRASAALALDSYLSVPTAFEPDLT